jgi:hypothetical protein
VVTTASGLRTVQAVSTAQTAMGKWKLNHWAAPSLLFCCLSLTIDFTYETV